MANHHRKMVAHADHLEAAPKGPPWIVLWDTTKRPDGNWSTVRAQSEAAALERAAHFVKLGFIVHAIMDPDGTVVMDAAAVARRFAAAEPARTHAGERPVQSDEEAARRMVRSFVELNLAVPGRMLAAATLRSQLVPQGMTQTGFERAVLFAKEHGWVIVAEGIVTLTQTGYAVATA